MRNFFLPSSIALVGASEHEGSIGRQLFQNLLSSSYQGKIYPVNIRSTEVLGKKTYKTLGDLPKTPDLVLIAIRDEQVIQVIKDCGEAKIKSAIVISDGFGERSSMEGLMLQHALMRTARENGVRILGPSSMGIISPYLDLNASISNRTPQKGSVAFISQSGAMCNAILDWGKRENVGFSYFASIGVMADINWGDILLFLADDPHTRAILLYMESMGNARHFLSAVREVAYSKPIIVVKPGKTEQGARVTLYNSGSLSGNHEVFQAAFRRGGVLQVSSLADLFYMSSVLGKQPVPKGNKLAIITNAGAPAVLATDALIEGGGELATLSDELKESIASIPEAERWWINNPLNIHLSAKESAFSNALEIILKDSSNNGVLLIITPQMNISMEKLAEQLIPFARVRQKPLIVSIMGGQATGGGRKIFTKAGIPVFSFPDVAARVFNYMWQYGYNMKGIYETPRLARIDHSDDSTKKASGILNEYRQKNEMFLSATSALEVLKEYNLPVLPTQLAYSEEEAIIKAKQIGLPVAMKLNISNQVDKYQRGAVKLNLYSKKAIKRIFNQLKEKSKELLGDKEFTGVLIQPMVHNQRGLEMRLSSRYDEHFGPVLELLNLGRVVEAYQDKVLGLPPLNSTLALRMLEQSKIYQYLKLSGKINQSILDELQELLVGFSQLVAENTLIKSIDIEPLLMNRDGISIANVRIELHANEVALDELTPLAIRPYPTEYEFDWKLKNGEQVLVRPVRPDDEPLFLNFHKTLSDESVYLRYFHPISFDTRVSHERLSRICFVDYDREMALLVVSKDKAEEHVLGIGRIVRLRIGNKAEFSITISDKHQGQGVGSELMKRLIYICKKEGVGEIIADILPNNMGMRKVCEKFGYTSKYDMEEQVIKVSLKLD